MRLLQDRVDYSAVGVADILLALLTLGFWLVVFAYRQERPYRCQECGTLVEPGSQPPEPEGDDVVQKWE